MKFLWSDYDFCSFVKFRLFIGGCFFVSRVLSFVVEVCVFVEVVVNEIRVRRSEVMSKLE